MLGERLGPGRASEKGSLEGNVTLVQHGALHENLSSLSWRGGRNKDGGGREELQVNPMNQESMRNTGISGVPKN